MSALSRILEPGGRLIQFCFAPADHAESDAPYPISEAEVRRLCTRPDWAITTLWSDRPEVASPPEQMSKRFARYDFHPELDERGSMLLPVLVLEAQRRDTRSAG